MMRFASLGFLAACTGASGVMVTMTASEAAPAYGETPFPTDALRDGDHLATIAGFETLGRHGDLIAAHLAALDGFGVRPLVEFFVDGALDPSTIPDHTASLDDAAFVVDVDPSSPEHGRVVAMDWHYDDARGALEGALTSGQLLREGTRYAAILTTAVHDGKGGELHRAAALDTLVASAPARWQSTADAYRDLALGDRVAGIAVFTTEHASAPLVAARAAMDQVAPPTLGFANPAIVFAGPAALDRLLGHASRWVGGPRDGTEHWGNDNPTGMAHDHVGVVGTGQMTVARFVGSATGTNGPEDKTFQLDASGTPQLVSIDPIPVTFILPAAPPPAAGYPIIIYGHGLGAGRDQLLSFAEPFTAQGYAVVGIDMVGHGSRFDPTDNGNNLARLTGFTGDASLPDGFGDNTGLSSTFGFFDGFMNVAAVRDSIRQSALDLSRLVQLLRSHPDLTALAGPGGMPSLDTSHLAYLGESFGTVVGTVFAAIEPDIDLYVLDVPGGGVLDKLLPDSAEIGSLALPFITAIYNPPTNLDRWNPLLELMQAVIDGADPLTYAPHILADRFTIGSHAIGPRSVVCLEVVGDQVLANSGTEALARGLGLDVLTPDLAAPAGLHELASPASGNRDGQTAILVQYAPATHGANWSSEHGTVSYLPGFPAAGDDPFPKLPAPITITEPMYETLAQTLEIVTTHQAGQAPVVRSTKPPVHDFDDDGIPDDQDPSPYDPAH
jgi:hypothetical protein